MPKAPSALYNHNTRDATARQLNISGSGRNFASYTTSQIPLAPAPPEAHPEHEYYTPDMMDIDIDEDSPSHNHDPDEEPETIEVMPGVHVKSKTKAKRYENSVGGSLTCLVSTFTL